LRVSNRWRSWRREVDLEEYNSRWDRLASQGVDVHGEADFVSHLLPDGDGTDPGPASGAAAPWVLDGGCGTGRVAVELARRGCNVVGVDNDIDLLDLARAKTGARSGTTRWVLADLGAVRIERPFDVAVLAGDVISFVEEGRESLVVANLARHLGPGGFLVSGQAVQDIGQLTAYDRWCQEAGLVAVDRFAGWDGGLHHPGSAYAVSVHLRLG
jgi:SAM-dependent methyltransferase